MDMAPLTLGTELQFHIMWSNNCCIKCHQHDQLLFSKPRVKASKGNAGSDKLTTHGTVMTDERMDIDLLCDEASRGAGQPGWQRCAAVGCKCCPCADVVNHHCTSEACVFRVYTRALFIQTQITICFTNQHESNIFRSQSAKPNVTGHSWARPDSSSSERAPCKGAEYCTRSDSIGIWWQRVARHEQNDRLQRRSWQ